MDYDNTKMIELTLSGVIRTKIGSDQEAYPFAGIKMKIPNCPQEYYITHAKRMFEMLYKEDKELKKVVFQGLIKIYVDGVGDCEGTPACVDKDVKVMEWLELQHLACCLLVREIPFYMHADIRSAREKAYETYMKVIKKKKVLKSAKDRKIITERIQRKYDGDEDFTTQDVNKKIDEAIGECFNMIVNPNNPHDSYSFVKLPSLIPVKSKAKEKKVDETANK